MNAHITPAIGHNNPPPESITQADGAFDGISRYLKDNPVVLTLEDAKTAKTYIDAAKSVLKELEAERDSIVRPFNEHVRLVNSNFKAAREKVEKLLDEVKVRLDRYLAEEERKRLADLEVARKAEAEARRLAMEAEAKEAEAKANAAEGEFTDVGAATAEADSRFAEFKSANRTAHIAARDAKVRINDGLGGRALSRRTVETLEITDWIAALAEITKPRDGVLPEKIADALLAAARDYRKSTGVLPPGVVSHKEKSL